MKRCNKFPKWLWIFSLKCGPVFLVLFSVSPHFSQQTPSQSQASQSGDELHYAELAISRNGATSSGISSSSKQITAAPPTGNYEIKYTDTKNTLPNKPPAYDYFKEPTVYAQIDHFKTMQHKSHAAKQPVSPATMTNSASASNAYQLHHQNATQASNPYYQQQQAQPHSQLQYGSGTLSNSNTLTFSNQSPSSQSQQSQLSLATNTSKQYSREIVTIRTPLLCSQQESCV